MKPALFILGLVIVALLTVKGLSWSGQMEGPLFRGVFQGQLMVGF